MRTIYILSVSHLLPLTCIICNTKTSLAQEWPPPPPPQNYRFPLHSPANVQCELLQRIYYHICIHLYMRTARSILEFTAKILYVVHYKWFTICGSLYVVHYMWFTICGSLYVVHYRSTYNSNLDTDVSIYSQPREQSDENSWYWEVTGDWRKLRNELVHDTHSFRGNRRLDKTAEWEDSWYALLTKYQPGDQIKKHMLGG